MNIFADSTIGEGQRMCSLHWNLQLTWKHSRLSPYYCRSMPHCPLVQRPVKDHSALWSTLKTSSLDNGLALLYVHRDIPQNYDSVIDDFAKGTRRLEFWMIMTMVLHCFQNHFTFNFNRSNCSASWMFCVAGTVIHSQTVYSTFVIE